MLCFCFSGLYHLLNKPIIAPAAMPVPQPSFNTQDLRLDWSAVAQASGGQYFSRANVVAVDGQPYLRLALAAPKAEKTGEPAVAEHHSSKPLSPIGLALIHI